MGVGEIASHQRFMARALALADEAERRGEVPVGAVVVRDNKILGEGFNRCISSSDPTAHAEIEALREAARQVGNYRLPGAVLYVTLEPCSMCAGAIVHARIGQLVFAASEPKAGVAHSCGHFFDAPFLNHKVAVVSGVEQAMASEKLSTFFKRKRAEKNR